MLTRYSLRSKVFTTFYSLHISKRSEDFVHAEKFFRKNTKKTGDLFYLIINIFLIFSEKEEKKYKKKKKEHSPEKNIDTWVFQNPLIELLHKNASILEGIKRRNIDWFFEEKTLFNYLDTLGIQVNDHLKTLEGENIFSLPATKKVFKKCILPFITENQNFSEFIQEIDILWSNDIIEVVHALKKWISQIDEAEPLQVPSIYFRKTDEKFAISLLQNSLEGFKEFSEILEKVVTNWEIERMALIDTIIIKMGYTELETFPETPKNVIFNEYIELAREYSNVKSVGFVNGILNKLAPHARKIGI